MKAAELAAFREDMERICSAGFIPWGHLKNRTVLVTGSTGLIGFHLVSALLHAGKQRGLNIRVLGLARNREKAERLYRDALREGNLRILTGTVEELPPVGEKVDGIVHGAAVTSSREMTQHPMEVLWAAARGTGNLLELARKQRAFGVVFLSSMEVYGQRGTEEPITEETALRLSPGNPRDSYPIGKAFGESLCIAGAKEYGIRTVCLRLSQVLGRMPGSSGDQRLVSQILEDIRRGRDICLLTKGESKRTYVSLRDAVTAILLVLLDERAQGIYNVSEEESYTSVRELCDFAARDLAGGRVKVVVEGRELPQYPPTSFLNLSSARLKGLGWHTSIGWKDALRRMQEDGEQNR